jgi:hypothetical protein
MRSMQRRLAVDPFDFVRGRGDLCLGACAILGGTWSGIAVRWGRSEGEGCE